MESFDSKAEAAQPKSADRRGRWDVWCGDPQAAALADCQICPLSPHALCVRRDSHVRNRRSSLRDTTVKLAPAIPARVSLLSDIPSLYMPIIPLTLGEIAVLISHSASCSTRFLHTSLSNSSPVCAVQSEHRLLRAGTPRNNASPLFFRLSRQRSPILLLQLKTLNSPLCKRHRIVNTTSCQCLRP